MLGFPGELIHGLQRIRSGFLDILHQMQLPQKKRPGQRALDNGKQMALGARIHPELPKLAIEVADVDLLRPDAAEFVPFGAVMVLLGRAAHKVLQAL